MLHAVCLADGVWLRETTSPEDMEQTTGSTTGSCHATVFSQCQVSKLFTALKSKTSRFCLDRIPRGSGPFLVFILNVLESFVFYGSFDGLLQLVLHAGNYDKNLEFFLNIGLTYSVGRLLYPIGGFLADVYFGRFKVIRTTLLLFWVAFGIMAVALSLHGLVLDVLVDTILPIVACVLVLVASGGFETTIIPFGAGQLPQGASSEEISSYFYWYYFGRQGGILLFVLLSLLLGQFYDLNDLEVAKYQVTGAIQALMLAAAMTLALCLVICFEHRFFKDTARTNPLKLVVGVTLYASTAKRQAPRHRRAFRYGEAKKPRIELAKIEYDGIYSSEEVEDTKTFCQLLLLLFSLGGYFIPYTGAYVMISYQMSYFSNSSVRPVIPAYVAPNLMRICNIVTILICLPIMNHLIVPFLQTTINMKHYIGFGVFLNLGAVIASIWLEWFPGTNRLLWLLLPAVLLSMGEMFVAVTALQFIYAQSPENMKGLLIGLFYFIIGLFNGGGALLFHWYPLYENRDGINYILWYYVILTVIGVLGFVAYLMVAFLYTYRQRPVGYQEERDAIRRLYEGDYGSVYRDVDTRI